MTTVIFDENTLDIFEFIPFASCSIVVYVLSNASSAISRALMSSRMFRTIVSSSVSRYS